MYQVNYKYSYNSSCAHSGYENLHLGDTSYNIPFFSFWGISSHYRNQFSFPLLPKPHAVIFAHAVSSYYTKFPAQGILVLLIYSSSNNLKHHTIYDDKLSSECDITCIVFTVFLCLWFKFILITYVRLFAVRFELYYYLVIVIIFY